MIHIHRSNDMAEPLSIASSDTSSRVSRPAIRQARYFMATIRESDWEPKLEHGVKFIKGQLECGDGGFRHYQLLVTFAQKKTIRQAKSTFGVASAHFEPTRSAAANDYVWKEDTRIGEPFQFGSESFQRNSKTDWDRIRNLASAGEMGDVPSEIYIRYYSNLQRIRVDSLQPIPMERSATVFWGPTGTGKSRRAWEEAGGSAYSKDPRTKFWCGYNGQQHVIIDEFRGAIDISHLLRWLDRYPVRVEVKGSSVPLQATKFWLTSNIHPSEWYPLLDQETESALFRRLNILKIS